MLNKKFTSLENLLKVKKKAFEFIYQKVLTINYFERNYKLYV